MDQTTPAESAKTRADACTICGCADYSTGITFVAGGGVCGPCLAHERAEWERAGPPRISRFDPSTGDSEDVEPESPAADEPLPEDPEGQP